MVIIPLPGIAVLRKTSNGAVIKQPLMGIALYVEETTAGPKNKEILVVDQAKAELFWLPVDESLAFMLGVLEQVSTPQIAIPR